MKIIKEVQIKIMGAEITIKVSNQAKKLLVTCSTGSMHAP